MRTYLRIKGDRVDGHDYAENALKAGAGLAIVSRPTDAMASAGPLLVVDDVLKALEKIGLAEYFAFRLSAEKVGANKPRPNLFHAALHRGNAKAHETVHIGDHCEDDIYGAQQLGIHTIWFNPQRLRWEDQSDKTPPSAVVYCLSEIPAALARLP